MSKMIDVALAQQQLVGWKHGKDGYSLVSLLNAMALTKSEWEYMKVHFRLCLNPTELREIDEYFKKHKK